jgi:hypothetical protein
LLSLPGETRAQRLAQQYSQVATDASSVRPRIQAR